MLMLMMMMMIIPEVNMLTGDALHGNFGNEGPRRVITRANPTQSEARSGKKTVRRLSRGGGGGVHKLIETGVFRHCLKFGDSVTNNIIQNHLRYLNPPKRNPSRAFWTPYYGWVNIIVIIGNLGLTM